LVDDYQDGREMYADALTFDGFRVVEAASGPEALRLALERLPDLILMDLSLPGLDGWEVASRLKADQRTQHVPIIALTAHALDGERERAEKAGCNGFTGSSPNRAYRTSCS
jgi:two-component system cell cycle response regulator DivK